ncbi:MAG: AAA family ATPase [Hyphomicrobiaceae bacterium]
MLFKNRGGPKRADPARSTRVPVEKLRRTFDPSRLGFATTAELEPVQGLIGQDRALRAIRFGVSIRQSDFNLFVLGPPESGKSTAVQSFLKEKAGAEAPPSDWVYVNNFSDPEKPKAIRLPTGRAERLARAMIETVEELKTALPAMFESDEYQSRRRAIDEQVRSGQEGAFETLNEHAKSEGIALLRTPTGFAMAPMHEGKVIKPEVYESLPKETREAFEAKIGALQRELETILEQMPRAQKDHRNRLQALNEEMAEIVVRQAIGDVEAEFADLPVVTAYLTEVRGDFIRNVGLFLGQGEEEAGPQLVAQAFDAERDVRFRRYMVNVMVGNGGQNSGAPIVDEINPTYGNLIGRVEHIPRMGALLTDFLLIRPGALHRANGGYLLLDARKLLTSPYAYEAVKRALKSSEIKIEPPVDGMGLITTQSLQPDPIPLNVKVILFGDRQLYYLLMQADPDFARIFKVQADFDETIDRNEQNFADYARLIASIVAMHGVRHVDASGVARLIEEASRIADDNEKLSIEIGKIADIVREADFWAAEGGRSTISRADISQAVEEQIQRADRARDKTQESFAREIMLLDVSGSKVGQINGLSVLSLGNFAFGRPSRITARVRLGAGKVTDIEREVELGGPLHSKGVMILWGYLAGRFAEDVPLAMAASLVFEQSYGGVDGDSASSAELYALLSALGEVPIKQSFAVTGSVNQLGEVQAIGGVNEKIEGFFDVCKQKGLTGEQGVLIPMANVQHLMLREDVVEAASTGQFQIHSVATIDEGIEILTGLPAGQREKDGKFPKDSVNGRVESRLRSYALTRHQFLTKNDTERNNS